jgi:hypothetical protein
MIPSLNGLAGVVAAGGTGETPGAGAAEGRVEKEDQVPTARLGLSLLIVYDIKARMPRGRGQTPSIQVCTRILRDSIRDGGLLANGSGLVRLTGVQWNS